MSAIHKAFLSSSKFAVVGASKDQAKWGTKVLQWYIDRKKDVTPVHPREPELLRIATVKTLVDLPAPTETASAGQHLRNITQITIGLLRQAKELSIPALWLQPGTWDDTVEAFIKENLSDRVIYGGSCILVEGDGILKSLL